MLVVSVHSCLLYRSSAQSAHTFDTSSEYALKQIRHNCIDVGNFSCTSIIKRVCKVYVSERMSDCPGGLEEPTMLSAEWSDGVLFGPMA